ncbi:MAG: RimK family alpha-L-glutamate ligase [Bacilli bacterium]|nr:RimK family alpha-L-glutamate ligase [Bacilli bacterium]
MNGIIITNQQIGHNQYKIDRFITEFNKVNVPVETYINDGTLAEIKDSNVQINLPKADFVIYLDKDIYLARLLEKAGYRLFNRADFIKLCDDKVLTFIACSNMGIKMPTTFAGPLVYFDIENKNLDFLKKIENELGYPMVVKKVYGSLGEGVYLVQNNEELRDLYLKICRNPILFQRYVKTSKGHSVRVLIVDGKVFGLFSRKNDADFRSNFGVSAGGEPIDDQKVYVEFAQNIADKLNIEYAGIDLLDDEDGTPILCEINSNAFFEEFEKVTGLNAAKAFVDMVIRKVNAHE